MDSTLPTKISLNHHVNTDPRVTAARAAFDAFIASEAGQALDSAAHGPNWRQKMAALDETIMNYHKAYAVNHVATKCRVLQELQGQSIQSYTDITNHVFDTAPQ